MPLETPASAPQPPRLVGATPVLLVGNIEDTLAWYRRLGFAAEYFPPGFAILRRDAVEIFLQVQPGYTPPQDPGRVTREAWNAYIRTDRVEPLFEEFQAAGATISRPLCRQDYGALEFDVIDLNGYRLVFAGD